jgi:predicted transcriptional regulator of viral defense system
LAPSSSSRGSNSSLRDFFALHPVFRLAELRRHLDETRSPGDRAAEALLRYHVKAGHLVKPFRGVYAVVPAGYEPETVPVDAFLLACALAPDAVLAYHAALQFHGRAYSVGQEYRFMSQRRVAPLEFRGARYVSCPFPMMLVVMGKERLFVEEQAYAGGTARVTSLERTLVDVLDRPDLGGGWEEIWRSLDSVEYFDLDQVVTYTLAHENATLVAKVGFYLEQHRERLMVEDSWLDVLKSHVPEDPRYLQRKPRSGGRLVQPWNLIVPELVLNQAWEEIS